MTQTLNQVANSANGHSVSQNLIQELIKEGLSTATQSHGDDEQYRRLAHILVDNCLLAPLKTPIDPERLQHIDLTLTILRQQPTSRPGLLFGGSTPLIKWILPRLIQAATDFARLDSAHTISQKVVHCIADIVNASPTSAEGEAHSIGSDTKVSIPWILVHLLRFVDDVLEGNPKPLFEYKLPPLPASCIICLAVILRSKCLWAERLRSLAVRCLVAIGQKIDGDVIAQCCFVDAVAAISQPANRPVDLLACPFRWPFSTNPAWTESQARLAFHINAASSQIQLSLWSTLLAQLARSDTSEVLRWHAISRLVTPVEGGLNASDIDHLVGRAQLQNWQGQMDGADLPPEQDSELRRRFSAIFQGSSGTAAKRKRSSGDPPPFSDKLGQQLPELVTMRGEGDIIDHAVALAEVADTELASRISSSLFDIFREAAAQGVDGRLSAAAFKLYDIVSKPNADQSANLRSLCLLLQRADPREIKSRFEKSSNHPIRATVIASLSHKSRTCRAQAGRAFSLVCLAASTSPDQSSQQMCDDLVREIRDLLNTPGSDKPMLVATLGSVARHAKTGVLGIILETLLRHLGAPSSPLRSLTYTTLLSLCKYYEKTPFSLISPHLERISVMLVETLSESPEVLAEATSFIGQTRQNFLETTLQYTLPAMVLKRNRQVLEQMASILQRGLGMILLGNTAQILTQVFLAPDQTDRCLVFLVNLIRQIVHDNSTTHIDATTLMTSCTVPLLVALVIELGDEDPTISRNAATALRKAQIVQRNGQKGSAADLGNFLKPHMLGVMTHLNETLHDVRGKKSPSYKRKLIRSLKTLIELVGDSIASYSPQIMASLQSTLSMEDLRHVTLTTWLAFTRTLRYSDVGPFVGRTTAALVANWVAFDDTDRKIGRMIIMEIADNARHLTTYLDDVVGLDHIPELREAAAKLTAVRKNWNFSRQLTKLLDRVKSKNVAIAITSIRELRDVLLANPKHLATLSEGDAFQPLIASTVHCLLAASSRDSEFVGFCDLAHECLGIIGALDPDRFASVSESHTMTIMSNFTDPEESIDFAIHLVRDLLVDAFRATNDTKLQGHLAYAIQELLQFCGFSPKLLQSTSNGSVSLKIRNRWMSLPKDQHETLTPLLESRFTLTDGSTTTFAHPIYPTTPTYREWIQSWTMDLINQVMASTTTDRGARDSKAIFGVFRGVLRNQDAAVAHHILPHLVLNVLLSGGQSAREQIGGEINSVLQDQVSVVSPGSTEKRTWSAQVIFDLMDHLSKWLRLQRTDSIKADKSTSFRAVESVISTMEVELMANAALQSRAYARSLRGFEQRIIQLRRDGRRNTDLQTYFEKLHLIYANLGEPDGMEGVSTFVIAPSLEHQIREHESTGRWTSAQSCWEVRLQQSPNDVTLHQGLLHCLRNLGHYDTLRTHIRGILSVHPEWSQSLATFEAEAACIIGDWPAIRRLEQAAPPIARVLLALHDGQPMAPQLLKARRSLGESIASKSYARMYQSVLDLHALREVETIQEASSKILSLQGSANQRPITQDVVSSLIRQLDHRFHTLAPSFQVREQALSIRRAAFGLTKVPELRAEIASTWIQTAKIARKSGYEQTAYSAILQAQEVDAPYAFLQQAKLLRVHSGAWKALTDLQNMAQPIKSIEGTDYARDRSLAKVLLLEARWAKESDRFDANAIIERYKDAIRLAPNLEGPYYHLGHYYDSMHSTDPGINASYNYHTCHNYLQAMQHGVKYIFQTMPRLLTLWLDLGEDRDIKKAPNMSTWLKKITSLMDRSRKDLAAYQFLTAYPQIVSRIVHSDKDVGTVLLKIMSLVLERYPQQALWPTIGVMQSKRADRKAKCAVAIQRAQRNDPGVASMIAAANRLGGALLRLAEDNTEQKKREMLLSIHFPYVKAAVPSRMIIPLQEALTCLLPSSAEAMTGHNPFPDSPVEILDIDDKVEVMPSLQRPKKLVLIGTDGKKYPFLCKPHDDLRKDARLMDMNAMINKLLKSASDSRRRRLYIRTYAVMPLNEECGLLQWVANTKALKTILEHGYLRNGQRLYSSDLSTKLADAQKKGPQAQVIHFREDVLKRFSPTVFHEWFLTTWPEPSAWLASRMSYSRTLAVMSMIGYVLGLGDRHGENILFDSTTGDTVHVDLNCLFDKGKSFDIPERVPFRLTQNLVDALGVTGVEGVFRKAAEIALGILRSNSDTLMSVLEAFAHDPLVEWSNRSGRAKPDKDVRATAEKNLKPIRLKLQGIMNSQPFTVPNQVDALIKEATDANNLGIMYQGWAAWL